MVNFDTAIKEVATKFNAQIKELSPGVYSLDIPFKLKDGSSRYQYVYAWVIPGRAKGKDCFYFNSRCGTFDPKATDTYNLLKEAAFGYYSMITITKDKLSDGTPCETVIVQASPIAEHIDSSNELADIVWEVAEVADIIEEKYFGGDKN
ncbi:hypothetical protein AD998_14800 [bacterium 336/3]|nr:hypothetical protein AD998_14800 [bacterium 336/3]